MKKELCLKDTGMAHKNQRNSQTTWMQDGHITEPLQGSQKQEEWTFSQETTFGKKIPGGQNHRVQTWPLEACPLLGVRARHWGALGSHLN